VRSVRLTVEGKESGGKRKERASWIFFFKKHQSDDLDTGSSDPVGGQERSGHEAG
jgi:hypothetical protein